MKLYEVPRYTWVRVLEDVNGPPSAPDFKEGDEYYFDHIDGMYSFGHDRQNKTCYLKAWTEVEIINDA